MKENKMIKKIISILLIGFLIITTKVYAAGNGSFQTTLTANKTEAKAGDTVTITMGLSDISIASGDKGIGSYQGRITFDSSVLEYVSKTGTDKWEAPTYNNGAIAAATEDGEVVTTTQSFGTITFKVKEGAKLGETTIGLEDFLGSEGDNDIATGNKSIKITVVGNGTNNNGGSSNNNDNNQSDNNNANKGQSTSGNSNKLNVVNTTNKENIKKGILPKAGNSNIVTSTAIGGCILLAIILYVRWKVINGKVKNDK